MGSNGAEAFSLSSFAPFKPLPLDLRSLAGSLPCLPSAPRVSGRDPRAQTNNETYECLDGRTYRRVLRDWSRVAGRQTNSGKCRGTVSLRGTFEFLTRQGHGPSRGAAAELHIVPCRTRPSTAMCARVRLPALGCAEYPECGTEEGAGIDGDTRLCGGLSESKSDVIKDGGGELLVCVTAKL